MTDGIIVVFENTSSSDRNIEGTRRWSLFPNKQQKEDFVRERKPKTEVVIAEGVSVNRAVELVKETMVTFGMRERK